MMKIGKKVDIKYDNSLVLEQYSRNKRHLFVFDGSSHCVHNCHRRLGRKCVFFTICPRSSDPYSNLLHI